MTPSVVIEEHDGISVVRDDLIPGGTKARFLPALFAGEQEVVYASPACGGAQLALAYAARQVGRQATIFVAKRKRPHARTLEARSVGANIVEVSCGYLSNVQAKAREYANLRGARLLAFGANEQVAVETIAAAAAVASIEAGPFDEVWCAAGSGVLARAIQRGIGAGPKYVAVQVGREIREPGMAHVLVSEYAFEREFYAPVPFPSCPNYDRKAWALCRERSAGRVLFWNVVGESPTAHSDAIS